MMLRWRPRCQVGDDGDHDGGFIAPANDYGNAIIGRYGGCSEEGYMVGLMHRRKLRGTREASKGERVRVHIIHGLNIRHKELTYLLQKPISYQNKVLRACS